MKKNGTNSFMNMDHMLNLYTRVWLYCSTYKNKHQHVYNMIYHNQLRQIQTLIKKKIVLHLGNNKSTHSMVKKWKKPKINKIGFHLTRKVCQVAHVKQYKIICSVLCTRIKVAKQKTFQNTRKVKQLFCHAPQTSMSSDKSEVKIRKYKSWHHIFLQERVLKN